MLEQFSRTEILLGNENMVKLYNSKVAIFGIGGVGSFAAEALTRSGIGNIILIDYDIIDISNLNRQIHADFNTIGQKKVIAMKNRLLNINKELNIKVYDEMYTEENTHLLNKDYDYVIDAIDMVSAKISLIENCNAMGIRIISAMGAGNKLDPTQFQISDIYETNTCPLAKIMRKELRKRNIEKLKVVWSKEKPIKVNLEVEGIRKSVPGSVAYVPSVCGLILAGEVIKDLIGGE
jgi:tRNA A37 threonylcarbamoyladenosine dehydratase